LLHRLVARVYDEKGQLDAQGSRAWSSERSPGDVGTKGGTFCSGRGVSRVAAGDLTISGKV